MSIQTIITRTDAGYNPRRSLSGNYLQVKDFIPGDNDQSLTVSSITDARQEVWLNFSEASDPSNRYGVELINKYTAATNYYKLVVSDVHNSFSNTVSFKVLKKDTTESTIFDSGDITVLQHDWIGVRFATRDTAVQNKVYLEATYKVIPTHARTPREWSRAYIGEDESSSLWNTEGQFGWEIASQTAGTRNYNLDDWAVMGYGPSGSIALGMTGTVYDKSGNAL